MRVETDPQSFPSSVAFRINETSEHRCPLSEDRDYFAERTKTISPKYDALQGL